MKLIDRDLLLSEIEKSREKNPHSDSKIRANHTIEHDHIAHLVLEQPAAYDADKVVERLKNQKLGLTTWAEDEAYKMGIEKAIEIVKSGGVE